MKNTAINTIKYTGIVTLSQYIGSKKVKVAKTHNEGGNSLFNFFADCLVGDFDIARPLRPTKIALIVRTGRKDAYDNYVYEFQKNSSRFFGIITKPEKVIGKTESHVKYSFVIPKEIIENLTDFTDLYLGLYHSGVKVDDDGKAELGEYAALCKLDLAKNSIINAALAVDWELIVSNISTYA